MEMSRTAKYFVGILVVSDTVSKQLKEDRSGVNLERILYEENFFSVSRVIRDCVSDEKNEIEKVLKKWSEDGYMDLILTVGGTGFSPRDNTPEATKAIIEKEAPHVATYMIMNCCEKTKFAVLSRSVCGIRRNTLILNLPGSTKGSEECFEMVAPVLPHAMDQLKSNEEQIVAEHLKIQGNTDDRTLTNN